MDDHFFCELKNKLDNGSFDGADLYDNFKIINKQIQADFFTHLRIFLCNSMLPYYLCSLRTAFRKVGV